MASADGRAGHRPASRTTSLRASRASSGSPTRQSTPRGSARPTSSTARHPACPPEDLATDDRGNRQDRSHPDRGRAAHQLPRLRDERHRQPRAARRARRPEAGPSTNSLHDARDGPHLDIELSQVCGDRRRGDGQVPPARRSGPVRRAGPPRPDVLAALSADRRPGQLRLGRRRPARGDALHRGAHDRHRGRGAGRHRQADGRLRRELRRHAPAARGAAGQAAQPARQRLVGHRRGHGDQHPAASPRRGRRRNHCADRQPRS